MAELKLCDICYMPVKEVEERPTESYFEAESREYGTDELYKLMMTSMFNAPKKSKENWCWGITFNIEICPACKKAFVAVYKKFIELRREKVKKLKFDKI